MIIKNVIEELYKKYEYPETFKQALTSVADTLSQEEISRILGCYQNAENFQFEKLTEIVKELSEIHKIERFTLNLFALVCLVPRFYTFYAEHGIDKQVADDTIADIKYKYNECKNVYGVEGVSAWEGWYKQIFSLRLFQIGRLQYEYETFLFDRYEKDGKIVVKGDEILSVHIPATGTPLSHEACEQSYELAKMFFAKRFEGKQMTFVCWSWLLNPENEKIMDEKSNIVRFKRGYEVIDHEEYPDYNVLAPWIFGRKQVGDLTPTEQDTSLQKRIKAHLKNGGKLGRGYGVFFA